MSTSIKVITRKAKPGMSVAPSNGTYTEAGTLTLGCDGPTNLPSDHLGYDSRYQKQKTDCFQGFHLGRVHGVTCSNFCLSTQPSTLVWTWCSSHTFTWIWSCPLLFQLLTPHFCSLNLAASPGGSPSALPSYSFASLPAFVSQASLQFLEFHLGLFNLCSHSVTYIYVQRYY